MQAVTGRHMVLAFSTLALAMLASAAPASATTETFNYTGAAQTWTVPAGVTEATFDLHGAEGEGDEDTIFAPGLGGEATATIAVLAGTSIQVNVGGEGSFPTGGFNGGGAGAVDNFGQPGTGGGGASDIRIGGTTLEDRVLVAGGGGGGGGASCNNASAVGGNGGGLVGLPGASSGCAGGVGGGGGTQTAGGSATSPATDGAFGLGGTGGVPVNFTTKGGGGGGGWYGGGGGENGGGGGGGSGHGPPGTTFQTGVQSGNGVVTITYTVPSIGDLIDRVTALNLPAALEKSLLGSLDAAQQNPAQACNELAAFISQVAVGESSGKISGADGDQLIGEAEQVRTSLGCDAALGACAGREATIVGTARPDKLRGTNGDDVIAAKGGDDTVVGLRGDDLVCGGVGADVIRGKSGRDRLRGGRGKDELRGGGGSDRCRGGAGVDRKQSC